MGKQVIVTVGAQTSNAKLLNYDAPIVDAISPSQDLTNGGSVLVVSGRNFFTSSAFVTVGFKSCPRLSIADGQITCLLPAGVGRLNKVVVTAGSQLSAQPVYFNYSAPVVSLVQPPTGPTLGVTSTLSSLRLPNLLL